MVGIPHMDAVAALIVVAVLAWSGLGIVLDGLRVLLDASIEKDVLDQVRQYAEGAPGVREVVKVEGRNSGSYRFLTLSFIPSSLDLKEAGEIAKGVASAIREGLDHVDRVDVEFLMEPPSTLITAVPLSQNGTSVSSDFGGAPLFGLFEVNTAEGRIVREDVVRSPMGEKDVSPDIRAAVFLAKRGVNTVLLKDRFAVPGAAYVLQANHMETVMPVHATTIDEAREYALKNQAGE
jgi:predicted Fe-Mo cluster-binding NifX family protein